MPTHTPRPSLDPVTMWRIAEVAKSEGRSLANAAARLIQEAWDARCATQIEKALLGNSAS